MTVPDTATGRNSGCPPPSRLLLLTALSVLCGEALVMTLVVFLPWELSPAAIVLMDALALTFILLPALYFFLYRPMADYREGKREAEAEAVYQMLHDGLTGLPNRTVFEDRLAQEVSRAKRSGASSAVVVVEVHGLTQINDTVGHTVGDEVLLEAARRTCAQFRASDTVARLGGNEFGVLMPEVDQAPALKVLEQLLLRLKRPISASGLDLGIDATIGVAFCPLHGADPARLVQFADTASRAAKRNQRGYCVYNEENDPNSMRKLKMLTKLREAIASDSTSLVFQPKWSLSDSRCESAEVLIRWTDPELGPVSPAEFVPIAEQNGVIKTLTMWMLNKAFSQSRELLDAGLPTRLALNLSVYDVQDDNVVDRIAELQTRWAIPSALLEFEITETGVMTQSDRVLKNLERLSALGFSLTIDDFGTGYSSFEYLSMLPVQSVKIDMCFVRDLPTNAKHQPIVRAMIDLAHALGLKVVAEGVEDAATVTLLRAWGCDIAQGFHFARPMAADAFLGLLREQSVGDC